MSRTHEPSQPIQIETNRRGPGVAGWESGQPREGRARPRRPSSCSLLLCLKLSDTQSISLEYEPSSEPLRISAKYLLKPRTVSDESQGAWRSWLGKWAPPRGKGKAKETIRLSIHEEEEPHRDCVRLTGIPPSANEMAPTISMRWRRQPEF